MDKTDFNNAREGISPIFVSTEKKSEEPYLDNGFSAIQIRRDTCASCTHLLEGSSGKLTCRIFTFENKKHGVMHLDSITLNHANYCNHFEAIKPIRKGTIKEIKDEASNQGVDAPDIEETVIVRKKISYPNTKEAQYKMRTEILNYLETGHTIKFVELGKITQIARAKETKNREEEITLLIKKP